jgi:hypothetical protein
MVKARRIGLDLDNTVIDYTPAYPAIAKKMGLPEKCVDRESIRRFLRLSANDDLEWQEFQSNLYTEGLRVAQPAEGLDEFLSLCASLKVRVSIISHKTLQTPEQFGARNLRIPALQWLFRQGIVPGVVREKDVYFCNTRDDKVRTISASGCEVFVDDLFEVLTHPELRVDVARIHYSPDTKVQSNDRTDIATANFTSLTTWLREC